MKVIKLNLLFGKDGQSAPTGTGGGYCAVSKMTIGG